MLKLLVLGSLALARSFCTRSTEPGPQAPRPQLAPNGPWDHAPSLNCLVPQSSGQQCLDFFQRTWASTLIKLTRSPNLGGLYAGCLYSTPVAYSLPIPDMHSSRFKQDKKQHVHLLQNKAPHPGLILQCVNTAIQAQPFMLGLPSWSATG